MGMIARSGICIMEIKMHASITYPPIAIPEIGNGEAVRIADGLFWLRMPLAGRLAAINLWALTDGDGWTIVDTGLRRPETAAAWRQAFVTTLESRPVHRIIATHLHPDHTGMAGWLVQKQPARLWMTRLEYLTLQVLAGYTGEEAPAAAIDFYRQAGWNDEALDHYRARFGDFGKALYPPPDSFRALVDGQTLEIGERRWEVVVGSGHSPEHAMLWCREAGLLISGDQVLPEISANVSVHPLEPDANPLGDWLRSLRSIRDRIPDDVLVLPAHGKPFVGLHARIDALIGEHERNLARLLELLATPKRAIDVFPALFKREIRLSDLGLATGESLAHLAYLREQRLVHARRGDDGSLYWQAGNRNEERPA